MPVFNAPVQNRVSVFKRVLNFDFFRRNNNLEAPGKTNTDGPIG